MALLSPIGKKPVNKPLADGRGCAAPLDAQPVLPANCRQKASLLKSQADPTVQQNDLLTPRRPTGEKLLLAGGST